jgi:hypothetical protein
VVKEVRVPERTAEQVQNEIESARDALADAVDQLATRTNPKRAVADVKHAAIEKAKTPLGLAVVGGAGAVVVLLVALRIRAGRRSKARG